MTHTPPGGDIRGFYAPLGIQLTAWARAEASVRCFADAEAHRRGDRDRSCSINLTHGAWHCHGCGARGGAFDAAIARGYPDREAIDFDGRSRPDELSPPPRARKRSDPGERVRGVRWTRAAQAERANHRSPHGPVAQRPGRRPGALITTDL